MSAIVITGRGIPSTVVETDQANTGAAAMTLDMALSTAVGSLKPPSIAGGSPGTAAAILYDPTQLAYVAGAGGSGATGFFPRTGAISTSTTDTIVDDTVAGVETAFVQTYTIPANLFNVAGKAIKFTFAYETVTGVGPPTLQLRIRLTNVAGTQIYTQAAAVAPTASVTRSHALELILIGTGGAGASVNIHHTMSSVFVNNSNFGNSVASPIPMATNGALVIVPTAQWASNAANTHSVKLLAIIPQELN